jgi:hypothetical protein
MSASADGIERWARLLRAFGNVRPGSPDFQRALHSLGADFATGLAEWLRAEHPLAAFAFNMPAPPSTAAAGAGVAGSCISDMRRMTDLVGRWINLQSQLAGHWSNVAQATTEKFVTQWGLPADDGGLSEPRKLFARWIDCAEEAYAETAHSDGFARLVGDLINTSMALELERRRCVTAPSRAADIPTRHEIDAIVARIEQLERRRRRPAKKKKRSGKSRNAGKRRL